MPLMLETATHAVIEGARLIRQEGMVPEFLEPERVVQFAYTVDRGRYPVGASVVIQDTRLGTPRGGLPITPTSGLEAVKGKALNQFKNGGDPVRSEQHGWAKAGAKIPKPLLDLMISPKTLPETKLAIRRDIWHGFLEGAIQAKVFGPTGSPEPGGYSFSGDENSGRADMDIVQEWLRGRDIFAPFLTTGASVGEGYWGVEGRDKATGEGLADTVENVIKVSPHLKEKIKKGEPITVGMHGFGGDVASYFLQTREELVGTDSELAFTRVIAIGDETGSYRDPNGLNLRSWEDLRLISEKDQRQVNMLDAIVGDADALRTSDKSQKTLTEEVDILITAAYGDVIVTREDLARVGEDDRKALVEKSVLVDDVRAGICIEGGNCCVTADAQKRLKTVAGSIANAKGSQVSWQNYQYGLALLTDRNAQPPSLEIVRANGRASMDRRFYAAHEIVEDQGVTYATAMGAIVLGHWAAAA